jgi:3-hydroxy acid dehydrogenase/malonic semialdehyde reductase
MVIASARARLAGKTILITRASSGIGRSIALEFARACPGDGLRLILAARRVDALRELESKITSEISNAIKMLAVKLDVSKANEVAAFVPGLPEEWRSIDILVNNA